MRRGKGRGREERCSKSQEGGILCGCGRNTPPTLFFITEGKQGPPDHCLIITSMEGRCELGGMSRRRKRKQGNEEKNRGVKRRKKCIPESPTGAEYVVPPVSLDDGPESGESTGRRETVN